MANGLSRRLQL